MAVPEIVKATGIGFAWAAVVLLILFVVSAAAVAWLVAVGISVVARVVWLALRLM